MVNLTIKQEQIKRDLESRYDYISKLDAIKAMKKLYGQLVTVKDISIAWKETGFINL